MSHRDRDRAALQMARRVRSASAGDLLRLREDAGVTRAALAREAGVDPSFLRRIELGVAEASLETYARLAATLGADLSQRLYPNTGPTIRDRHQARIAEAMLGLIHPRWSPFAEIGVRRPSRGWIDLGLHDVQSGVFVATEVQSELRRLEQLIRWSDEKAVSLPSWEGWAHLGQEPEISRLLVVRTTRSTKSIAREFGRMLRTAYPAEPEDALAALRGGSQWPGAAVLWATIPSDGGPVRLIARP